MTCVVLSFSEGAWALAAFAPNTHDAARNTTSNLFMSLLLQYGIALSVGPRRQKYRSLSALRQLTEVTGRRTHNGFEKFREQLDWVKECSSLHDTLPCLCSGVRVR